MTETLAQVIALTGFGNDFLKNGTILTDFNTSNTTFQFCTKVDFREFEKNIFLKKPKESLIAKNPIEWFQFLKSDGCKHLRLYFEYPKDQKLTGLFVSGGSWLIEAVYENHSNYWANRWELTRKNASDGKIWTVIYGLTGENQHISNMQIDNQIIKEKLRQTLTEIADFAYRQDLKSWGGQFEKAKLTLDSLKPERTYCHTDLIPEDRYSLTAKQIIYSACSAWVFGGMGSWNDLCFESKEDKKIYDRLSDQLYSNINEAIIAGINTY
jgi:hypothetical protein